MFWTEPKLREGEEQLQCQPLILPKLQLGDLCPHRLLEPFLTVSSKLQFLYKPLKRLTGFSSRR